MISFIESYIVPCNCIVGHWGHCVQLTDPFDYMINPPDRRVIEILTLNINGYIRVFYNIHCNACRHEANELFSDEFPGINFY